VIMTTTEKKSKLGLVHINILYKQKTLLAYDRMRHGIMMMVHSEDNDDNDNNDNNNLVTELFVLVILNTELKAYRRQPVHYTFQLSSG
jgi:hypothetical protein